MTRIDDCERRLAVLEDKDGIWSAIFKKEFDNYVERHADALMIASYAWEQVGELEGDQTRQDGILQKELKTFNELFWEMKREHNELREQFDTLVKLLYENKRNVRKNE
jgi:hypothetical protein